MQITLPIPPQLDWSRVARFDVLGAPVGQPRPRGTAIRNKLTGKWTSRTYNPGTADGWKRLITAAALQVRPDAPLAGPVRVDATFYLPRPKRLMRKRDPAEPVPHAAKPDRDNLDKVVLDAMGAAAWWGDDAQVCAGWIDKWYAPKDGATGVVVTVWRVEQ